jgi:hypothetical protein
LIVPSRIPEHASTLRAALRRNISHLGYIDTMFGQPALMSMRLSASVLALSRRPVVGGS